jgi:hypothetical protein
MSLDKSKNNMDDIKYVEEAEETEPVDADRVAEEKALVRKIDISLLPCIWIMYLLSYMDVRQPHSAGKGFHLADHLRSELISATPKSPA